MPVPWKRSEYWVFRLLAFWTLLLTGLLTFTIPPYEQFDDMTLFNPVYEFFQHGKLIYPAHGFFESMIPHPPLHYFTIGLLMKAGLNSFYAVQLLPFFLLVAGVVILFRAPFPNYIRSGFLMGYWVPLLFPFFHYNLQSFRPDYSFTLWWYGGLLLLESSRRARWDRLKLFLGGVALGLASVWHYVSVFAFLGAAPYLFVLIRNGGIKSRGKELVALFSGLLIIGIPFILFFVLPNYAEILGQVLVKRALGSGVGVVEGHFGYYETIDPGSFLLFPAQNAWIPLFVLGSVPFFLRRDFHLFVFGALPLILFIFLFSSAKLGSYLLPEMSFFLAGFGILLFYMVHRLRERWPRNTLVSIISFLPLLILVGHSWNQQKQLFAEKFTFEEIRHEMHLARACGKEILGSGAKVGSRMGLWYVSGATQWKDVSPEFLYPDSVSPGQTDRFFSQFDILAEHNFNSNFSLTKEKETLISHYVKGSLFLKGFYLSDNGGEISDLSYLLFSREGPNGIRGFTRTGKEQLVEFEEDPKGLFMLVFYRGARDAAQGILEREHILFNTFFLPDPTLPPGQSDLQAREVLIWFILPQTENHVLDQLESRGMNLLEKRQMKANSRDFPELLNELEATDLPLEYMERTN